MRKVIMLVATVMLSVASYAQDVVKDVTSCKNYKEALEIIGKGLSGVSDQDKAKIYNKVVDLAMKKITDENFIIQTNQISGQNQPFDTLGMYDATVEAIKASLSCYEFDNKPNEKGKVKPKFTKKNSSRLFDIMPNLINAGGVAYGNRDYAKARDCFELFLEASKAPLFIEKFQEGNENYAMAAYFAALTAYNDRDYAAASKFSDLALNNEKFAKDAAEIKVFCMKDQMKTKDDSVRYINVVKDLHQKFPQEDRYFSMIVEFYSNPGYKNEMKSFIEQEAQARPNDPMVWAVQGEYEMNQMNYDDAIEAYIKALQIKPDFLQVVYNVATCYYQKAVDMKNAYTDVEGRMLPENETKVLSTFKLARDYMLKAKDMDPERTTVNWAYPLCQIYYGMGDEVNAKKYENITTNY